MPQGERRAVLSGLHEAQSSLAVWQPSLVWVTWIGRLAWLCRSEDRCRLRLRDQPDGNAVNRSPPGLALLPPAFLRGVFSSFYLVTWVAQWLEVFQQQARSVGEGNYVVDELGQRPPAARPASSAPRLTPQDHQTNFLPLVVVSALAARNFAFSEAGFYLPFVRLAVARSSQGRAAWLSPQMGQ